ncbi:uncharacterized protein LOC144167633 [Haemaphysalis longicornis]
MSDDALDKPDEGEAGEGGAEKEEGEAGGGEGDGEEGGAAAAAADDGGGDDAGGGQRAVANSIFLARKGHRQSYVQEGEQSFKTTLLYVCGVLIFLAICVAVAGFVIYKIVKSDADSKVYGSASAFAEDIIDTTDEGAAPASPRLKNTTDNEDSYLHALDVT